MPTLDPELFYEQYLAVLDERDAAVERYELAEARLAWSEPLIAALQRDIEKLERDIRTAMGAAERFRAQGIKDARATICDECGSGILDGEHIANYECSQRCEHEWVSARNEAVESGEMCVKCHALRAEENDAT